jgi:hypothetical protein
MAERYPCAYELDTQQKDLFPGVSAILTEKPSSQKQIIPGEKLSPEKTPSRRKNPAAPKNTVIRKNTVIPSEVEGPCVFPDRSPKDTKSPLGQSVRRSPISHQQYVNSMQNITR